MKSEIYIVDDNTDYQFILFQLLKELQRPYAVTFFSNARALHQRILQRPANTPLPSLIILDLNMPGMNGLQLLKALRDADSAPGVYSIPVVIMGHDISDQQMRQCYRAGANAVIAKPIDYHGLKHTVQSVCRFWLDGQVL